MIVLVALSRNTKLWLIGGLSGGVLLLATGKAIAALRRKKWDFGPPLSVVQVHDAWWEDRSYRNGVHMGLDMVAPIGTPVYSIGDGVVTYVRNEYAGNHGGMYVIIQHPDGMFSQYVHLDSNRVKAGQRVKRGEQIGTTGASAMGGRYASSPHLHFSLALDERLLPEYAKTYGMPSTGFIWRTKQPNTDITTMMVPAEPLIPGAYKQRAWNRADQFGFKMHPASTVLSGALAGVRGASVAIL